MNCNLKGTLVNPEKIYGKSAYEIAVMNGFDGTEEEWLNSLVGKSAYEIAVKLGFDGTEKEWLDSIVKEITERAETFAGNAAASATAAKNANDSASEYEKHASEYASQARSSEQTAVSAKNAAESAVVNAIRSESNAKASENNAKASETNAKASEESAKASADNAAESASTAHVAGYNAAAEAISDLKISWNEEKESAIAAIESAKQEMIEAVVAEIEDEREAMLEAIEKAAEIVQTTGDSETAVMSQKATTEAINLANNGVSQNAEAITQTNERISQNAEYIAALEQGLEDANNRNARNSKRITNLEQGLAPDPFETDDSAAYKKDVPENALPYAAIQKIGGAVRRCPNLLNLIDKTNTSSGVTATVSNQSISFSGTPVASTWNNVGSVMLSPGTYTISCPKAIPDAMRIYFMGQLVSNVTLTSRAQVITFTIAGYCACSVFVEISASYTSNTSVLGSFELMLNTGSSALPYEPYHALRFSPASGLVSDGANLLKPMASVTQSGVTMTVDQDGVCTLNGYCTGANNIVSEAFTLPVGSYWLSDSAVGAFPQNENARIQIYSESGFGMSIANNKTSEHSVSNSTETERSCVIRIRLEGGHTYSNCKLYPMLNRGESALPFRPYFKNATLIPDAVQALAGYGDAVDSILYNYVDLEKRLFGKHVGKVDLGTIAWYWGNNTYCHGGNVNKYKPNAKIIFDAPYPFKRIYVDGEGVLTATYAADGFSSAAEVKAALSGVMLCYELATPEIRDISGIISADNFVRVEPSGTLTFENEHHIDVPSTVVYQLKGVSE